jgi:hypothetical protein
MKRYLRHIVVVAIAVLLLALFLRQANLRDVWIEIRNGRLDLVAAAVGVTLITYVLRALRWQYLLRALGPVRLSAALRTTVIGFALNFLTGRLGEVVRPYLLARDEHLSATSAFATVILERLLDMAAVLVLFAVFLLVFDPRQSPVDPALFRQIRTGGVTAGISGLAVLGALFLLAGHPERAARLALRVERVLPARIAQSFSRIVHMFVEGLKAVRQPGRLALTFLLSFPLWLSIAMAIFLVTRAFHVAMPFLGAFVVMAMLVVGVAIPTPGAVGGFEYFYQVAVTGFYGAPPDRATAAALVLHGVSFLPVTLLGIILMAREGLSLGRMRGLARLAAGQEQEGTQ